MNEKHIELWLKLGQFLIGTVVLGVATLAVNSQIQKREVEIKEMEMLGKFVEHAINDNVAVRQRFANYFATVSRSEDFRDRWGKYKKKIDVEFQMREIETAELKKQKEQEEKKAEELRQKLAEAKVQEKLLTIQLQEKNTLPDVDRRRLESQKIEQEIMLKEVQAAVFERDAKLASVRAQLEDAKAEITYPEQRIQQQVISKSGWVYLGEFDTSEKIWIKTYWSIDRKSSPESLEGKSIRVSVDAVNVRNNGDPWAEILDVMKLNSTVRVDKVDEWGSSGYFWARIIY